MLRGEQLVERWFIHSAGASPCTSELDRPSVHAAARHATGPFHILSMTLQSPRQNWRKKKKLTTLEYLCFLLWRPPNSHRVTDREKCKTNHVGILASLFGWQMINKSGTMLHDGSQSQDPPHGNTWSLWMLLDGTFLAKTDVFVKIFFFFFYWLNIESLNCQRKGWDGNTPTRAPLRKWRII